MISIIIPVYNQAKKLAQCLDSIAKQSYDNYEIIIVNDGSTDNIEEIIEKYKLIFGVKLFIIKQRNQGSNPARNRGEQEAKGEYLLFCDADIIMQPEMLKIMLATVKNHLEASYAYSSFKYGAKTFELWPFSADKLKQMPYIHTTSLICKEHFPGFDENIKRLQDWDLWLTMLERKHTGIWIDQILFKVQTGGTMSSWLPSFVYKLLPFLPSVKKYNKAVKIIKAKHKII
ncbi:glycosyltransferase family 2 protein [Candidatus Parcubacteria bacterium]|nr:glycosyltransferase family 2 protein [Candidatus Parcubacteria bacterium]